MHTHSYTVLMYTQIIILQIESGNLTLKTKIPMLSRQGIFTL